MPGAARRWIEGISGVASKFFSGITTGLGAPPASPLRRFGLAGELGDVGCALFELRDSPRFVRAARASCADAQFACQAEGTRRAAQRGRKAIELALAEIPDPVRVAVMAAGYELRIAPRLTDVLPRLAGVSPRGHLPGVTWDQLDGGTFGKERLIVIAETALEPISASYVETGSVRAEQLLRHEYGHAWDLISGLSSAPEFIAAYDIDASTLHGWLTRTDVMPPDAIDQLDYMLKPGLTGRQEAFAEIFAYLHGGGTASYIDALQSFPEATKVVKTMLEQMK